MSTALPPDPAAPRLAALVPLSQPGHPPRGDWPLPLTSFVGREREIAAAAAALRRDEVRLLTLTGPGGVGKTRLALRVIEELADEFPDGAWFVPLAPVHDPALVAATVAGTLGVREVGGRPLVAGLRAFLREKRVLLLLDNFEHVLEAGPTVTELLATCPRLAVLATSRAVLRLSGEHALVVPPLALPDLARLPALDEVSESPAVRLFVERARAARADFALTADNAAAVAQICHRLDGLPLAVELAAARSSLLPPALLLDRLEPRLPLLTSGPRDAPARLQTMGNAIAWSHDLLDDAERTLFRRLSIFVGGFTLEGAEAIGGTAKRRDGASQGDEGDEDDSPSPPSSPSSPSVLDGIASLADKSLLRSLARPAGESDAVPPRFGMLETIREFGLEQLAASGEATAIASRHGAYLLALAEAAEPALRGLDQIAWLDRLESELPNLRAALERLRDAGDHERGLRLAAALWTFWVVHDHVPEGRRWLEVFLASEPAGSTARSKALVALGDLAERLGDYAAATAWTEEALRLARGRSDRAGEAAALRVLGNVAISRGSVALHSLHDTALAETELTRAESSLEQSLALARELGDEWGAAKALHWLNNIPWLRGDLAAAIAGCEETAAMFRRLGDRWQLCMVLASIGILAHALGDLARARAAFAESLGLAQRLGYLWFANLGLVGLASVAADGGEGERAARLLGAAAALREAAGEPLRRSDQVWQDRAVAAARGALGEAAFAAAWAAGRALSPEAAVAEALAEERPTASPEGAAPAALGGLTPREREVLRLLAEGRSDPEIAAALFVSRRTAATHVASIFRKLGVSSRAAAAAYAVRHGLA